VSADDDYSGDRCIPEDGYSDFPPQPANEYEPQRGLLTYPFDEGGNNGGGGDACHHFAKDECKAPPPRQGPALYLSGVEVTCLPEDCAGKEEVIAQGCTIRRITHLPAGIVRLEITYSCLAAVEVACMPDSLAYVDLSHNSLRAVPDCLYELYERRLSAGRALSVKLLNNDLWFSRYTALPPSMVSPTTVDELIRAHRMNLVSTQRLHQAIAILRLDKSHGRAADSLAIAVAKQVRGRANDGGCTWDNNENVHAKGVQDSAQRAVDKVMAIAAPSSCRNGDPAELASEYGRLLEDPGIVADMARHFADDATYRQLAKQVMDLILAHPHRDTLLQILLIEVRDGMCTCRTGRSTRLVNALNGFVDGIGVGLSKNEEVANTIIVIRNRNSIVYADDMGAYIAETIPAALQALEDACVPLVEQGAWLEYV
jgi:hypothetical protein